MYELLKTGVDEAKLFFRLDGEAAERHGAIGYLRGDYGKSGTEFWTAWFDNQAHLKTPAFRREFSTVIDWLRDASQLDYPYDGTFKERCLLNMRRPVTDTTARFKIQTEDFSYYVRCQPRHGDYDFYCMAFDNSYLLPELAGEHKLPKTCFSVLPSSGELIQLWHGKSGYVPYSSPATPSEARFAATDMNEGMGVTRRQEEALFAGSIFGWNAPAAKPWNYDQDGKLRPINQPKKNEPER